jgi:O-antigen/teichoic acid export membrane protein
MDSGQRQMSSEAVPVPASATSDTNLGGAMTTAGDPLRPEAGLARRVVSGTIWLAMLRGTNQAVAFVRILVLARLLTPADFGLVGLVVLALMWVEAFSQPAFDLALVRTQEDTDDFLDTAWTLQAARAAVVALAIGAAALPVAWFFDQPSVAPMLWVMAAAAFLSGLGNVAVFRFKRDLEFNKQFVYEMSGILADLLVSVLMAFVLRDAWALIAGMVAYQFARLVAGYLLVPYRPRFRIKRERFRHLFGFGKWMLAENGVEFLMNQIDSVLIGRVFGPAALGVYQMAYRVANLPRTPIGDVAMHVALPAYAKLQADLVQARAAFFDTLRLLSLVGFPLAAGIALIAPEFVRIVLGPAWLDAIVLMQILAIYGALHGIDFKKPLVLALGRPDLDAKVDMIRLLTLAALLVPAALTWGLVGVTLAVLLSMAVGLTASMMVCAGLLGVGCEQYLRTFYAPALGSAALLMAGLLARAAAAPHGDLVVLASTIASGAVAYAGGVVLADGFTGRGHRALGERVWRLYVRPSGVTVP